jgi:hypothetical protein
LAESLTEHERTVSLSGITATRYAIEDTRERKRREQRAAWADYAAQRAELTALRGEAEGHRSVLGTKVAKVPAGRKLSRNAPAKEKALRAAPVVRSETSVSDTVGHQRPVTGKYTVDTERDRQAREKLQATREKVATRGAELLARLPANADAEVRAACAKAVDEITAARSEARAQLLLTDLTTTVRREERAAEEVVRAGATLAGLAAQLDAIDTDEATTVRAEIDALSRARAHTVPADLAARVDIAVENADRAVKRRMVAAAMRVSLDNLGYSVTEGFETVLVDQGAAYASLPGRPGYGLKVLLDAGQNVVRTQVVRSATAQGGELADTDAEKSFCDNYPHLLTRLRANGVAAEEIGTVPPGRSNLATVAAADLPATTTYQQRSAYQAREMGS